VYFFEKLHFSFPFDELLLAKEIYSLNISDTLTSSDFNMEWY